MEYITEDNERIAIYNIQDFNLLEFNDNLIDKGKKLKYFEDFGTFDIETTSVISEKDKKGDWLQSPYGFMYHWQFCLNNQVICGRTWSEFGLFIKLLRKKLKINNNRRFVVYVHNLSFEFQFMNAFAEDFFNGWRSVMALSERKVLSCLGNNGIEFRCSYKLSNMNLDKFTHEVPGVKHPKLKGDLDFRKFRTPSTELNNEEKSYCVNDVLGLYETIKIYMSLNNDNIVTIPLTSTGFVRRDCRKACENSRTHRILFNSNHMSLEVFDMLRREFRGGNTHANVKYSGVHVIPDKQGESFDITSSYPTQCMIRQFPITKFRKYGHVESMEELHELINKYPCLFRVEFINIELKENISIPYIPISKCEILKDSLKDNGRVRKASSLSMVVNDIDYKIIEREYNFEDIAISNMYISRYGSFPKALKEVIMNYFKAKTLLKYAIRNSTDTEEIERLKFEYAQAKAKLNAIYGMCATNPVREEYTINSDCTWNKSEMDIENALHKFHISKRSFVWYALGCWCTSWARFQLEEVANFTDGITTIYVDTDSNKCICTDEGIKNIEDINEQIKADCEKAGAYVDINGKRVYMGLWDREDPWKEFKTLGAKKYSYIDMNGGLHLTVSGVNKKTGAAELGNIDNFDIGFVFNKSAGSVLYYDDKEVHTIDINGEKILTGGSIAMYPNTYTIGITDDYMNLIDLMRLDIL